MFWGMQRASRTIGEITKKLVKKASRLVAERNDGLETRGIAGKQKRMILNSRFFVSKLITLKKRKRENRK